MITLADLREGTQFRFAGKPTIYTARGNGWYGKPYSGGPWHTYDNPEVRPLFASEPASAEQVRERMKAGENIFVRCRFGKHVYDCEVTGSALDFPIVCALDATYLRAEFCWRNVANGVNGATLDAS